MSLSRYSAQHYHIEQYNPLMFGWLAGTNGAVSAAETPQSRTRTTGEQVDVSRLTSRHSNKSECQVVRVS